MTRRPKLTTILAVALACGIGGLLLWSLPEASQGGAVAVERVRELVASTGASNAVCSIVVGARLLDTLFEVLVFSVAVLGVRLTLGRGDGGAKEGAIAWSSASIAVSGIAESDVVRRSAYLLFPLVSILGIYLAVFGHVSPGGGFGGGVVLASGFLLVAVSLGAERVSRRFRESVLERIEWSTVAAILVFAGVSWAVQGLPRSGWISPGEPGTLAGSGTLMTYNLLIAVKVFLGSWVIVHLFVEHRGEI